MEGQGIGDYSCIESVVMYGLLGGGNARAWKKVKGPNWVTGVFDASYNDEFGTFSALSRQPGVSHRKSIDGWSILQPVNLTLPIQ